MLSAIYSYKWKEEERLYSRKLCVLATQKFATPFYPDAVEHGALFCVVFISSYDVVFCVKSMGCM